MSFAQSTARNASRSGCLRASPVRVTGQSSATSDDTHLLGCLTPLGLETVWTLWPDTSPETGRHPFVQETRFNWAYELGA